MENVVKYSPGCKAIWVDVMSKDGRVAISIRDTGLGIPRNELKTIFGKFERGKDAKESGIKGTGVGLAIVEHIVNSHGGEIQVESKHGKGSTFTLLLPETVEDILHVENPNC
jgi:two-component system phosphate regulon sensor histidine kinase PhoR